MALNLGLKSLRTTNLSSVTRSGLRSSLASSRAFHSSSPRAKLYAEGNKEIFASTTQATDRITIVDFHADWCGPCHALSPSLEKHTAEPNKSASGLPFDLVKIDVDSEDGQVLAATYKVTAMPTVVAFRAGQGISQFRGAIPESQVKDFLSKLQ